MALKQLSFTAAIPLLECCLAVREPALLVGAPGIGKTDLIMQLQKKHGMDLILSHPVVEDSTNAKGYPVSFMQNGQMVADFIPYGDLRYAMSATRLTLWFLDDLGQAPPSVQASYMQLLLGREIAGKRISDNIIFIAATNDRTHRSGVTGLLEPVKDRFAVIIELVTNINDFCKWGYANNLYPTIPPYLRFDTKQLHNMPKVSNGMEKFPTPRSWAKLSKLLYQLDAMKADADTRLAACQSCVGQGAGLAFNTYEKTDLPDVDAILKNPSSFIPPNDPGVMYAIASTLARRASIFTIDAIAAVADRMPPQFAPVVMLDARNVCPDIEITEAYGRYSERISRVLIN